MNIEIATRRVDTRELSRRIAGGEPLSALPRILRMAGAARGQVLLDDGVGLAPFRADVADLVQSLRRVAGKTSLEILHFDESPMRGCGQGVSWEWARYEPPPPGQPVLCVSDFGVFTGGPRPSVVDDYFELADILGLRGCRLLALAPFSTACWPMELRGVLRFVSWDEGTGVGDVHRAVS